MSRPADWSPVGWSHDPVPGDPVRVSVVGRLYVGTADAIDRAVTNLSTALSDGFGRAEAIDAIREQAEDVAHRIGRAEERYRGVGEAMIAYAAALAAAQSDSADALSRADGAQSAGSTADWHVAFYEDRVRDPATPPANIAAAQESLQRWESEQSGARTLLNSARTDVDAAVSRRDAAAGIAIDAVRLVESSGDLNDGFWDDVSQWVAEHKTTLDLIGDILGAIAVVAGAILLFVPGLNALVLMIIAGALLLNLAYASFNGILQASTGNMTVGEAIVGVGLAALSFVGVGVAARVGTTAAKTAMKTALRSQVSGMTRRASNTIVRNITEGAQPWWSRGLQQKLLHQALDVDPGRLAPIDALARYVINGTTVPQVEKIAKATYASILGVQAVGVLAANPVENSLDAHLPAGPLWRVYGDGLVPAGFGDW